jgi:hypothetical protein
MGEGAYDRLHAVAIDRRTDGLRSDNTRANAHRPTYARRTVRTVHLSPFLFLGLLVACDSQPAVPTREVIEARRGGLPSLPTAVVTDGVAIAGFDDFVIRDTEKPAPFRVGCKDLPLTPDDYKQALKLGAKRVRIKVPQLDPPLFGVLSLCRMPDGASGPGSRAHRIQVPDSYVDATDGGRVSVVFEEVDNYGGCGEQPCPHPGKTTSWQLFLSRSPFANTEDDSAKATDAGKRATEASLATGKGALKK